MQNCGFNAKTAKISSRFYHDFTMSQEKKEILSVEQVHSILERAWALSSSNKKGSIRNLKVSDWDIFSSDLEILFDSPNYSKYKLQKPIGETFFLRRRPSFFKARQRVAMLALTSHSAAINLCSSSSVASGRVSTAAASMARWS